MSYHSKNIQSRSNGFRHISSYFEGGEGEGWSDEAQKASC